MKEIYISTSAFSSSVLPTSASLAGFSSVAFLGKADFKMEGMFSWGAASGGALVSAALVSAAGNEVLYPHYTVNRVLARYVDWVKSLPGIPAFVGTEIDHLNMYWNLIAVYGTWPFRSTINIRTARMFDSKKESWLSNQNTVSFADETGILSRIGVLIPEAMPSYSVALTVAREFSSFLGRIASPVPPAYHDAGWELRTAAPL